MLDEVRRAWGLSRGEPWPVSGSREHTASGWMDTARERLEAGPGGDADADGRVTRTGRAYVPGLKRTVSCWLRLYEQVQRGELGGPLDGQRSRLLSVYDDLSRIGGSRAYVAAQRRGKASAGLRADAGTPPSRTTRHHAGRSRLVVQRSPAVVRPPATPQDIVAQLVVLGLVSLLAADGLTVWAATAYRLDLGVWLVSLVGLWLLLWLLLWAAAGSALAVMRRLRQSSARHQTTPHAPRARP